MLLSRCPVISRSSAEMPPANYFCFIMPTNPREPRLFSLKMRDLTPQHLLLKKSEKLQGVISVITHCSTLISPCIVYGVRRGHRELQFRPVMSCSTTSIDSVISAQNFLFNFFFFFFPFFDIHSTKGARQCVTALQSPSDTSYGIYN